jgi:hypothetical protein
VIRLGQELKKPSKQVEFVTGKQLCPYCLSDDIEETDLFTKCRSCGMGKNKSGRR